MKVLVACEESQAVTIAFRERGHDAYSCDLLPCSGGHSEWHIQGDAIETLYSQRWDLVIAHPPCTYLANSGVRWRVERKEWRQIYEGVHFFKQFQKYAMLGHRIGIEQPIIHKYAREGYHYNGFFFTGIGGCDQIIQPWMFGHTTTKATRLWLYGLPHLLPTCVVTKDQRTHEIHTCPPGDNRRQIRSKTFPGIAKAMSEQWG